MKLYRVWAPKSFERNVLNERLLFQSLTSFLSGGLRESTNGLYCFGGGPPSLPPPLPFLPSPPPPPPQHSAQRRPFACVIEIVEGLGLNDVLTKVLNESFERKLSLKCVDGKFWPKRLDPKP